MNPDFQFDYTVVGHVTVDVLADGSRRAGGTAFYAALQASRLGQRTRVVTQGAPRELEPLLEPYRAGLTVEILPAAHTTTLLTSGSGAERVQRLLAWAGPIEGGLALDTAILHLAPIARETSSRWGGRAAFVGLTPQGLLRRWAAVGEQVSLGAPDRQALAAARASDAIVISEHEHGSAASLIAAGRRGGAVTAVTAGERPTTLLLADGSERVLAVPEVAAAHDDLGAGDVFSAAFFVALNEGLAAPLAIDFANAAASVRIETPGTVGIGDRHAIERRLLAAGRAG